MKPLRSSVFFCLIALVASPACTRPPLFIRGLEPETPAVQRRWPETMLFFPAVDTLQPTFRWEAFPRTEDVQQGLGALRDRIRHVTYELKIWRAVPREDGWTWREEQQARSLGTPVYVREGLPDPWHRLESKLEPSAQYLWTVRARFELDGESRVTEWGQQMVAVVEPMGSNLMTYFLFRTPSEP